MKTLLYLNSLDRQLWTKSARNWENIAEKSSGTVWVVTDLAEESFSEIKTPRLFGRDRETFIARQLAGRYPDTPFRGSMTLTQEEGLLAKIIPTQHILFGVDGAQRLNAELDATTNPIAGLWPISVLMAQLGRDSALPADLFVVLPGPGSLRIVFLKNRTPVLTRLTSTANEVNAQVEEVVRTLRHLENTQVVPRGRQEHPVLLLAKTEEYKELLAAARFQLVGLSRLDKNPPEDWRFPLFDLALKSPPGQVAPLERRVEYLSGRLSKVAFVLSVVIGIVGVAAASSNLLSIFVTIKESSRISGAVEELNRQVADLEQKISALGAEPATVRRAIALRDKEIANAPSMATHFKIIGEVLARDSGLRLRELKWNLHVPGSQPCLRVGESVPTPTSAEPTAPENVDQKVEVRFELAVPSTYGPRDRALALRAISGGLTSVQAITLLQDANKDLASASLRGGSGLGNEKKPVWCMTISNVADKAKLLTDGPRQ
jgi:outer membrane murein-binding lipoprotein Lpp